MTYNPNIHHRKSIRLKGYDYSQQGLYFITICCQNMVCLFGDIVGAPLMGAQNSDAQNVDAQDTQAQMILNDAGKMVETEWLTLTNRFSNIILHEFVVMPNHFHGIIEISDDFSAVVRAPLVGAPIKSPSNDVIFPSNDVIFPNDFDNKNEGRPQGYAPTHNTDNPKTIGDILDAFKSITTVKYINGVKKLNWQPFNGKMWHRNYYDNIIRNHTSYQNISNYIINNPLKWYEDKFYQKPKYHL
ncbi:MAG: transposase [Sphingobacteriales bacterium]|nr:MAG: transposase [Sphingobacteriales bacterium]